MTLLLPRSFLPEGIVVAGFNFLDQPDLVFLLERNSHVLHRALRTGHRTIHPRRIASKEYLLVGEAEKFIEGRVLPVSVDKIEDLLRGLLRFIGKKRIQINRASGPDDRLQGGD